MLQIDGKPINKCTCFMYLDPTPSVLRLIELWKQEIIDTRVDQNQVRFHSIPTSVTIVIVLESGNLPVPTSPYVFFSPPVMRQKY